MRYDGYSNSGKRTSIEVNQQYIDLAVLSYSYFMTEQEALTHFKSLLKQALKAGHKSDFVKKEIERQLIIQLKIAEIIK